jgi:hypothetical protein
VAKILASVPGLLPKATNARARISAALVTSRPRSRSSGCGRTAPHPADDEDPVVHRDAEQEGEDDDRHLDVDRPRRLDASDLVGPEPLLEDEHAEAQAAATESRFSRTALSGRMSDRNARARSRKVRSEMSASHRRIRSSR